MKSLSLMKLGPRNGVFYGCVLVLVAWGSYIRFDLGTVHFSQHDESFHLVVRMDEYQQKGYTITIGRAENDLSDMGYKTIRLLPESPISYSISVGPDVLRNNPVLYGLKIAYQSSYAPLYAFFAGWFIDDQSTYGNRILQLRAPSILFSITSLFLFVFLIRSISKEDVDLSGLIPIALLSASLMNVIYAAQGLPYGMLGGLFILQIIFIDRIIKQRYVSSIDSYILVFLSVLTGYSHWALQLNVVIFYGCLFSYVLWYVDKTDRFASIKRLAVSFLIYGLLIAPGIFIFAVTRLSTVAKRVDFFPLEVNSDFFVELATRYYDVMKSCFTFAQDNSLNQMIIGIITVFLVLGIVRMVLKYRSVDQIPYIFCFAILVGYTLANIAHLFPLSPTRHTIMFSPVLLLLSYNGMVFFRDAIKYKGVVGYASLTLSLGVLVVSVSGYQELRSERRSFMDDDLVQKIRHIVKVDSVEAIDSSIQIPPWLSGRVGVPVYWRTDSYPRDLSTYQSILFVSSDEHKIGSAYPEFVEMVEDINPKLKISDIQDITGVRLDIMTENLRTSDKMLMPGHNKRMIISLAKVN